MHAVLGTELRDRQLAPDRLECYFRFEFSVVTLACRLGHLYSSFPKDEPSLSYCPILRDPLCAPGQTVRGTDDDNRSKRKAIERAGSDGSDGCDHPETIPAALEQ